MRAWIELRAIRSTRAVGAALLAACVLVTAPAALAGPSQRHLTVLTYNVAGLPLGMSSSRPSHNEAMISRRLGIADLVTVQEDFGYHQQLISHADFPYMSRKDRTRLFPNPLALGDGLARLSRLPFDDYQRVTWNRCYGYLGHGADCWAPKGFAMARHRVAPGVFLDVYNLHADASDHVRDRRARRAQIRQLERFIQRHSAGHAVLVMGDTNSRYTRLGDPMQGLLRKAQLRDVWVELRHGGVVPPVGHKIKACHEDGFAGGDCELVDKILYRSSATLRLVPVDYQVPDRLFQDERGRPLSDHEPVLAVFAIAVQRQERAVAAQPLHVAADQPEAAPIR